MIDRVVDRLRRDAEQGDADGWVQRFKGPSERSSNLPSIAKRRSRIDRFSSFSTAWEKPHEADLHMVMRHDLGEFRRHRPDRRKKVNRSRQKAGNAEEGIQLDGGGDR